MKIFSFAAIGLTFMVTACGPSKSSQSAAMVQATISAACSTSPDLGVWNGTPLADRLQLNADCSGSSTRCASTFTFSSVQNGYVTIVVTSTNGASYCPSLGSNHCAFNDSNGQLTIDCGGGPMYFTK